MKSTPIVKAAAPGAAAKAGGVQNANVMGPPPPEPPWKKPGPPPPLPGKSALPAPPPKAAAPAPAAGGAAGTAAGAAPVEAAPEPELDPVEAKKEELKNDPAFARFLKALKLGVPPQSIRMQIRAQGVFDPDDFLMFMDTGQIMALKKIGDYKGDKY